MDAKPGAYEAAVLWAVEANSAVVVVSSAEGRAALGDLPAALGNRFIDAGEGEQALVGLAAGLALRGRIPICHAPATLLALRAFEFVRTDVGLAGLPVKLVALSAGFLSEALGPSHQALEDIGVMRGVPRMQVFAPADADDLAVMLPRIVGSGAPAYLRLAPLSAAVSHASAFEVGDAELLADGGDVTLFTAGFLLREALKARTALAAHGIRARVVNLRTVKPLDERVVLRAARETRLLVTVEDHFLTGALFSAVAEALARHQTPARVVPLALEERPFQPALLPDVVTHEGFTGEKIAAKVLVALG